MRQIKKKIPGASVDLSDPKIYNEFCREYGEGMRPVCEAVDEMRRRSMEHMLSDKTIIRGYCN